MLRWCRWISNQNHQTTFNVWCGGADIWSKFYTYSKIYTKEEKGKSCKLPISSWKIFSRISFPHIHWLPMQEFIVHIHRISYASRNEYENIIKSQTHPTYFLSHRTESLSNFQTVTSKRFSLSSFLLICCLTLFMAPNRENVSGSHSKIENNIHKPPKLSMENLQRSLSDISFELSKHDMEMDIDSAKLPPISEVEDAKCECCGMSEECTGEYINRVRNNFSGKLICGLCAEAVNEAMQKNGWKREEALNEHVAECERFNRIERKNPVLYQAEAIKEILKKCSGGSRCRAKSMSPRSDYKSCIGPRKGVLARSSSCIPSVTKDCSEN